MEIIAEIVFYYMLVVVAALLNLIWAFAHPTRLDTNKIIALLCLAGALIDSFYFLLFSPASDLTEWLIILTPFIISAVSTILIFRRAARLSLTQ